MPSDFDPYLQWLGIRDPQRPPNFYRLLGVALFEEDPTILTNAADRQMAHVRTFQTGAHAAESQRILNELAAAKLCLLNAQRKAEYDAWLRAEMAAGYAGPVTGAVPEGLPKAFPEPAHPAAEPAPVSSEESSPLVRATIAVLSGLVLLLIGLIVAYSGRKSPAPSEPSPAVAVSPGQGAPETRPGATKSGPEASETKDTQEAQPGKEEPPKPEPAPGEPSAKKEPAPLAVPRTGDESAKPAAAPKQEPKAGSAAEAIKAARRAISKRDLAAATEALNQAEKLAFPEDRAEIDRLREALGPLGAFWRAVSDGMAELKPGESLDADGRQVAVVASAADSVTLKIGERESRYTLENLPASLALAIASRRLADLPSSILAKAAFAAFDPRADRKLARQWCEEAARAGLPTAALAAELGRSPGGDEKPAAGQRKTATKLPIPDPADQATALAEVRKIHRDDFDKAVDRPKKKALGRILLKEAIDTPDDPVVRYVLLGQARDLAVTAGDPDLLREVIEETATYYQVDGLQQMISTLSDVAEGRMGSGGKKELAKGALDLAEERISEDDYDAALKLTKAAHAMALARDSATAKRATDLLKALPRKQREYERFQQAEKILAQEPDNPAANLAQGKYYCFVKDTPEAWQKGVPMLAKGSDPKLKALAQAELAAEPKAEAGELFNLAEQWYEVARAADETSVRACRRRALYWYEKALPHLQGFKQKKAKLRVDELKASADD